VELDDLERKAKENSIMDQKLLFLIKFKKNVLE